MGHEKFALPDENKKNTLVFEVNWTEDKSVAGCKLLRVHLPNGDMAVVRKEHLNAILFALGNEEEQKKMIPQVTRRSRWYETMVGVKAKKDIKKGEEIVFPIKLSLPTFEEEVIAETKRDILKGGLAKFKSLLK